MKGRMRAWLKTVLFVLLTGFAAQALAHELHVIAEAADGRVSGEALYADLSPAVGGVVKVLAEDGAELARVRVDDDGRFQVQVPPGAAHRVVVEDDEGHAAQVDVAAAAADLSGQREVLAADRAQAEQQETIGRIVLGVILLAALAWVLLRLRRRRPPPG